MSARFCWKCKADQQKLRPPDSSPTVVSSRSWNPSISFGRPVQTLHKDTGTKPLILAEFVSEKTKKHQGNKPPAKKPKIEEPVMIWISLMEFKDQMKPVWGKRLPIEVPKAAGYPEILEKAVEKWPRNDRNFDGKANYIVLCSDGQHARMLPGKIDFFELEKYKREVGKDFKRITLFSALESEYNEFEGIPNYEESPPRSPPFIPGGDEGAESQEITKQVKKDEELAKNLQEQFDNEVPMSVKLGPKEGAKEDHKTSGSSAGNDQVEW